MMSKLFVYVKEHRFIFVLCFAVVSLFALHVSLENERNSWGSTSGRVTYVKEVSDHNFIYTIEYMAQKDAGSSKVRLFKEDSSFPFRGQTVRLKYRKNNIQDFVLLGALKYMPDSIQDKS